jgi:hypothetical protein
MNQTRFGRLTILGETWGTFYGTATTPTKNLRCLCDCGKTVVASFHNVKRGVTKSCGCYRREWAADKVRTHGMVGTPEYGVWAAMKRRCQNPNVIEYRNYGGRGIRVCDRWQTFANFFADMGKRPDDKMTLDRKDTSGDYTPENCRWATQREQQNNRRNNHRYSFFGKSVTLAELSREVGIPPTTVRRWMGDQVNGDHLLLYNRGL